MFDLYGRACSIAAIGGRVSSFLNGDLVVIENRERTVVVAAWDEKDGTVGVQVFKGDGNLDGYYQPEDLEGVIREAMGV